ncbi:membrane progestin receptor gamma-A-like [Halichondria panicea]|uniref:membrane progestin receptor gamma-A-like n=1 Tax=Halichondria panicea TaxID=6063 RepID=UPI00312BAE52
MKQQAHMSSRTFTVDLVPEQYKERYLTRGYRQPYSSFLDCLVSLFRLNNETLNVWTHLIPLIIIVVYFRQTFPSEVWPPSNISPYHYPLLAHEMSTMVTLTGSVIAHTFNCMNPRIRHICFYVDYTAMAMFFMGGACASFYYMRPLDNVLFSMPNIYMGLTSMSGIVTVYLCSASRHKWDSSKYLIQTLAFGLTFLTGSFPSYYRLVSCLISGQKWTPSMMYLALGSFTYLVAAVLNAIRFPESHHGGTFDICGHSHQWMHVLTSVGTMFHIIAFESELETRSDELETLLQGVTFLSTLGWTLVTLMVASIVTISFGSNLTVDGHLKNKKQD